MEPPRRPNKRTPTEGGDEPDDDVFTQTVPSMSASSRGRRRIVAELGTTTRKSLCSLACKFRRVHFLGGRGSKASPLASALGPATSLAAPRPFVATYPSLFGCVQDPSASFDPATFLTPVARTMEPAARLATPRSLASRQPPFSSSALEPPGDPSSPVNRVVPDSRLVYVPVLIKETSLEMEQVNRTEVIAWRWATLSSSRQTVPVFSVPTYDTALMWSLRLPANATVQTLLDTVLLASGVPENVDLNVTLGSGVRQRCIPAEPIVRGGVYEYVKVAVPELGAGMYTFGRSVLDSPPPAEAPPPDAVQHAVGRVELPRPQHHARTHTNALESPPLDPVQTTNDGVERPSEQHQHHETSPASLRDLRALGDGAAPGLYQPMPYDALACGEGPAASAGLTDHGYEAASGRAFDLHEGDDGALLAPQPAQPAVEGYLFNPTLDEADVEDRALSRDCPPFAATAAAAAASSLQTESVAESRLGALSAFGATVGVRVLSAMCSPPAASLAGCFPIGPPHLMQVRWANDRSCARIEEVRGSGTHLDGALGAVVRWPAEAGTLYDLTGGYVVLEGETLVGDLDPIDLFESQEIPTEVIAGRKTYKVFPEGTVMQAINHSYTPSAAFHAPQEARTAFFMLEHSGQSKAITVNYVQHRKDYNMGFLDPKYVDPTPVGVYILKKARYLDAVGLPFRVLGYQPVIANKPAACWYRRAMKVPYEDLAIGLWDLDQARGRCDTIRGGKESNGNQSPPVTDYKEEHKRYGPGSRGYLLVALRALEADTVDDIVGYCLLVVHATFPRRFGSSGSDPYILIVDAATEAEARRKGVMSELIRIGIGLGRTITLQSERIVIHRPVPAMLHLLDKRGVQCLSLMGEGDLEGDYELAVARKLK